jgi:hypothetical protein
VEAIAIGGKSGLCRSCCLITAISAVLMTRDQYGYVNVAELFISLTLSTMYVLVKLIKYMVSQLCDG